MEKFSVYMHVNKINDKKYIGVTCQGVERRWRVNGYGYKNNIYFYNAINKNSWENFEHIILKENLTKDEAEQEEIRLIKLHSTTNRKKGYNIANGGNCVGMHSEETRKKMSEKSKLRPVDISKLEKMWEMNRNRVYSEDHCKNISKALTGKKLSDNHREAIRSSHLGYKHTEEQKKKISESNKKTKSDPAIRKKMSDSAKKKWENQEYRDEVRITRMKVNKPVILTNTKERFENHLAAWEKYNVQYSKIIENCNNESLSAGKNKNGEPLIWIFEEKFNESFDYQKDYTDRYSEIHSTIKSKKVICLTTGEVFNSTIEASKKYGLKSKSAISMVCTGKRKHSGKLPDGTKLSWKYAEL